MIRRRNHFAQTQILLCSRRHFVDAEHRGDRVGVPGLIFSVSVNTSSLSGQSGYLDFQFNPGDSSAKAATATVTLFQTVNGILAQPASLTGDAAGSLPGR